MTQDNNLKLERLIGQLVAEVEDFFEEFSRPVRGSLILMPHRSAISRLDLTWHDVEQELKKTGKVRIKRLETKNIKWYFPELPELEDATLQEMVELMG